MEQYLRGALCSENTEKRRYFYMPVDQFAIHDLFFKKDLKVKEGKIKAESEIHRW